jgi:hypothetical protein
VILLSRKNKHMYIKIKTSQDLFDIYMELKQKVKYKYSNNITSMFAVIILSDLNFKINALSNNDK